MSGALNPAAETISRANALYAEALANHPESHPQEAANQLRQVVQLDPHFIEAQVRLGNFLLQTGQLQSALTQLQEALDANPDSAAIEAMLAYARKVRGEDQEALRLASGALSIDPTQGSAMRVLLEIAEDHGDIADGVTRTEEILTVNGRTAPSSAWLALSRLYVEIARNDVHPLTSDVMLRTLLPIYQHAADTSPPDVETLILLSDTHRDLGQKQQALKILRQAAALEPSNVDIILRCADLEMPLGQTAEAIKDYARAYAINPNLTGLRQTLIRSYVGSNRFGDAIRLLQEALVETPDDPSTEIDLGIAYEGARQLEKADACFQQALASANCPVEAYLKLTIFRLQNKQIREAGETLVAAQTRFPASAKIEFYRAVQHRYAKEYDDALACLARERTLASAGSEPDFLDINYYLEAALVMDLAGRKNLIEPMLREGISKYPDNPDLLNELAYFWADAGSHLPEALTLSQRALQLAPESGPIQDTRGWVAFRLGRPKEALPYLQRAAILTNNDAVVLQHLGDAYLQLGRRRDAIATWRRALDHDPGNRDLAHRIDAALAQATHAHSRSAPNR